MRGGVCGMSWAVMIAAAAVAFDIAATPPTLAADAAAASPPGATQAVPKDDYYTRRAKNVLAAEKANNALKPHPLAAKYTGMEVVVCEAGCPEGTGAHVVSVRPEAAVAAARVGMMVPTSGTDRGTPSPDASDATLVACVAGCYDDSPAEWDAYATTSNPAIDAWVTTTVVPETPSPRPQRDKFSPIR